MPRLANRSNRSLVREGLSGVDSLVGLASVIRLLHSFML